MKREEKQKEVPFLLALIPFIVMITAMIVAIVKLEQGPHMPLIVGTITAATVAIFVGHKWGTIEEAMYKGIRLALPAIVILMLVGIIIGSWIGGGVVATMVYYGLKIISPSLFLVSITLICCVVSLAIGSSWSTMGTVGVAGMGIGMSMGIPAPMIAGAVISGAYFGDKMSPLSDTTNLAAGLTNTNLFVHVRHMWYTTIPGLMVALVVYGFLGRNYGEGNVDTAGIETTMAAMQDNFVISPWLLLVPLAVILLVWRKVPAIPALVVGALLGFLAQIFVQGSAVTDAVSALQGGFVLESGNKTVDELFNRGGLDSMMYTVSLILVAMTFGGVLEHTGMLNSIVNQILKVARTSKGIVASTVVSCFATNATCSDQYTAIIVPSRMYAKAYRDQGLHSKNLSRALEDGGTLTSVFIPWNTCAIFIYGALGVSAFDYAPYAVLNYAVPLISILYAFTGWTVTKLTESEKLMLQEKEAVL